ncbi:TrkA C-terminal domain-containing protein [Halovivax limisalsi]|uniref:TrkA C-terminal domain-containing protein n=1 Tax=Halovivax limisalsi TaxID=1453760 RepID=UPI001FFCBE62|nr:TrkA C-terminal domain-containing protein [Halovivax limisalsi]
MYALVSLILIISLSMLIVRVGTVALTMTGLSEEVASFQSLSAYSGAGFTTEEAEVTTAYPARRMVVKTLIRLGSVGLVTSIATLILSFTDPTTRLRRLVILLAAALVLAALSRSRTFNELLTPLIRRTLDRTATFELRDYVGLLNLDREYCVADFEVDADSWLANERLADLELRSTEGIDVLGIRREDGTYLGAPSGEHEVTPGDTVIAYGQRERLEELADRPASDTDAHQDAKAAHRRLLALERRLDPERQPVRPD